MNWIFPLSKSGGSGAGHLPPLTNLQQQRQRQIESVKASHSGIVEIQKDVEYRLPFTANNKTINLNILLPPQFPQEKPVVSVFPPVRHHLVDKHTGTVVTSPLITNFTMHSDLGKIIQTVLEEFWKNPPVLVSSSASFPYTSQLTDLNDNEDLLLEHFIGLPQLKQICTDKDDLVNYIEELAKKNLQLEPQLEAERQELLDKYDQLTQLKCIFEKKLQRQHELSEGCSLSALQARLKVAAHQAEEESDVIAEEFLEGKVEIDDFLSSFMEKRTICHCRRAKEEKLQHLIQHGQFHTL
ncbi:vacuolar protein sorting-associated protein 37A isoform X2 [Heterodontus francisci]|uniref:vacuolar protein sorting-associated protein 37A isoform X2 n=1 Tax=Heterodontus francisci TaxID=7792 RepID=UPI00355C9912